ncbi:hypothetical protein BGX38DRAFT_1195607 [Terfezia claveryi]|nr:hypothetical protein BGX38DRAFT_1195607 [Terfezia claveryi]
MTSWLVYYCFPIIPVLFAWILENQLLHCAGLRECILFLFRCFFYDVTLCIPCYLMLWIHFRVLVCGKDERGNILGVIFAVGKYSGIGVS